MLRAIGGTPTQPWYIGQTSPDDKHHIEEHEDTVGASDHRKDWRLRTSVWIVKAVACIMLSIYNKVEEQVDDNPTEATKPRYSIRASRDEDKQTTPHHRLASLPGGKTEGKETNADSRVEVENITTEYLQRYREFRRTERRRCKHNGPERTQENENGEQYTPEEGTRIIGEQYTPKKGTKITGEQYTPEDVKTKVTGEQYTPEDATEITGEQYTPEKEETKITGEQYTPGEEETNENGEQYTRGKEQVLRTTR